MKSASSCMEKALLVADTSDATNWGCHATSTELRKLVSERGIDICRTIFSGDLSISKNDLIRPDMADISYMFKRYANILDNNSSIPHSVYNHFIMPTAHIFDYIPKNINQLRRRADKFVNSGTASEYFGDIDRIDHIIINGEGSTHDMGSSNYRTVAWRRLFIAYVAKKYYQVQVHIINHSLQTESETFRELVRTVYPTLDTIIFRDVISKNHYNCLVETDNSILAADAAWLISDLSTEAELNKLHLLDGIEVWSRTGQTPEIDFTEPYICIGGGSGLTDDFQLMFEEHLKLIQMINENYPDYNILLTIASEHDSKLMLKLSQYTGLPVIGLHNNYRTAASIVANSRVYIGGRWHVSIFALLGSSQIVNFGANTHKINSIGEDLRFHQPIFEYQNIDIRRDDIMGEVKRSIEKVNSSSGPNPKMVRKMKERAERNGNIN